MRIVDVGSGAPIVIVPGIQGRWEWMKPAVDALAGRCRVITFSLADEPTCDGHFDPARGFECYVEQVKEAMEVAGLSTAVVLGVSYGGLVAAAFAARYPERLSGLALVSAIPPGWTPDARVRLYIRAPLMLSPFFFIASLRMFKEIAAARGGVIPGMPIAIRHALNALTHMLSPTRMARRVRLVESAKLDGELAALQKPTLVVTGDAALDNIVPVRLTEEYMRIWPHSERATIARTGHIGLITRPDAFAEAVGSFVDKHARQPLAASADLSAGARAKAEAPAPKEKRVG